MTSVQDVFLIGDGEEKAIGEIERRKFTVEEGDHLTLLNTYISFLQKGHQSSKWCHTHRLNFKSLSRAMNIRKQLKNYLKKFNIPIVSCLKDDVKVRKCLVSGYFRNAAKMLPDGSFKSARENAILHVHPSSVMFTRQPSTGWVIFHEVIETSKRLMRDVTVIEPDWLPELASHYYQMTNKQK